jgi:hypothetical protein
MQKTPVNAGTFSSSTMLVFDFFHAGNIFLLQAGRTFCRADAGRFLKSLKIKMTGKTAGDSPHGEEKSRT